MKHHLPKDARILLVNAPLNGEIEQIAASNLSCFPALGIVSLATQVKKVLPNSVVKAVDGGVVSRLQIQNEISRFQPHLVGISDLTPTHKAALWIARFAKEKCGSTVVLGNDHAALFGKLIIEDCDFVDFVVTSDVGEVPFILLLQSLSGSLHVGYSDIPNLVYRDRGEAVVTNKVSYSLARVYQAEKDIPDYSLLQGGLKPYEENYNKKFGRYHDRKIIPVCVNNIRGCGNKRRRCAYCSILDLRLNLGSPSFFWLTLEKYSSEYGANLFFEVCDSFGTFRKYRKKLLQTIPNWFKKKEVELMIYCRAQDLANDASIIADLKELRVKRVNIGLDAASSHALIGLRKGNTAGREVEVNKAAVERLTKAGIQIHASFVVGSPGETWEMLEETVRYIKELCTLDNVVTIEFSRLVPLPNSPVWDLFVLREESSFYPQGTRKILESYGLTIPERVERNLRMKYGRTHIFDLEAMTQDWINHFTHLENGAVSSLIRDINGYIAACGKLTGTNVV